MVARQATCKLSCQPQEHWRWLPELVSRLVFQLVSRLVSRLVFQLEFQLEFQLISRIAHQLAIGVLALLISGYLTNVAAAIVVIGHPSVGQLDEATIQKIYTGRVIEHEGKRVIAINTAAGNPLRARFLAIYLNMDEEKYTAYWTVRRYIGKGVPPQEILATNGIVSYVLNTPGAIAYVDEADLQPGLNILLKK